MHLVLNLKMKINEKYRIQTGRTVKTMTLGQQSVIVHGELSIETATRVQIMSGTQMSIVLLRIRNTQILAAKTQMKCRLHLVIRSTPIVKMYQLE